MRACARLLGRYLPPPIVISLLLDLLDEECGKALAGPASPAAASASGASKGGRASGSGIGLGVLHVLALVLAEVCATPARATDACLGTLVGALEGLTDTAASALALSRALGEQEAAAHSVRLAWQAVHAAGLGEGETEEGEKEDSGPGAGGGAGGIPASVASALERLRAAKAVDGPSAVGAGGSPAHASASLHSPPILALFRARLLCCALLAASLIPARADPVSTLTPKLLRLLCSVRGALVVEGSGRHWMLGEPKLCAPALALALAHRCPSAYQAALQAMLPSCGSRASLAALGEVASDVYRALPWLGLPHKPAPLPLGVLCDLALLALAQVSAVQGSAAPQAPPSSPVPPSPKAGMATPALPMPLPPAVIALLMRHTMRGGAGSAAAGAAPTPLPLLSLASCPTHVLTTLCTASVQDRALGAQVSRALMPHLPLPLQPSSTATLLACTSLPLALSLTLAAEVDLASPTPTAAAPDSAAAQQRLQASLILALQLLAVPAPHLLPPLALALHGLLAPQLTRGCTAQDFSLPLSQLLQQLCERGLALCAQPHDLTPPAPSASTATRALVRVATVVARAVCALSRTRHPVPAAHLLLCILRAWQALVLRGAIPEAPPAASAGAGTGEAENEEEEGEEEVIVFSKTPLLEQELLAAAMAVSALDVPACTQALTDAPADAQRCTLAQRVCEHLDLLALLKRSSEK